MDVNVAAVHEEPPKEWIERNLDPIHVLQYFRLAVRLTEMSECIRGHTPSPSRSSRRHCGQDRVSNVPRRTRHGGISPGQYADEHQAHHDLHKNYRHEEYRAAGQVLLGTGNGGRKEREVREVAEADEREEADAASISATL